MLKNIEMKTRLNPRKTKEAGQRDQSYDCSICRKGCKGQKSLGIYHWIRFWCHKI